MCYNTHVSFRGNFRHGEGYFCTIAQGLLITRDSLDADIKKTFRRVILKVHPDKGGSEAATKRLNEAWSAWQDEAKKSQGPGRPPKTSKPTPAMLETFEAQS